VKAEDQDRFFDSWTVFKCICAEIDLGDTSFVLAAEEWYAVVRDFVQRVNAEVAAIPVAGIDLPPFRPGESEGDYNTRAAEAENLYLFDRALVRFQGERGRVEFCDLLSEERQLIHVKRRSRSSLLSHLFMQGYVAAEAFIDHRSLREQIRQRIPAIRHLVPEDAPNPPDYEVVYALIHDGGETLPFFSKVALATIYKQLRRMQYRASLAWIETEAQA
jgi:uncharacterized protein (TIGR04141 family)